MKSQPLPSIFPHTKQCLRKGMHCEEWSWETGGTRSRESTPGQGKSKPEGVFQLPAWRGLIPFSATPRAVGRNTPQDCLPEKWKGECFSTSSVPGWSRVPKRLKSVPLTSTSGQGSPQREALQAHLGSVAVLTLTGTVSCSPCLSGGLCLC